MGAALRSKLRRRLIKRMSRTHLVLQRLSRGRLLGTVAGMPVLLLTTTGRHSGKPRRTPLTFMRDAADLVVIASNGGSDRPPDWCLNLQHDPRATVEIGGERQAVTARTASAAERERLWPEITAAYSGYARYQQRTAREIAVLLLSPDR
jgi:deazaflavin-dependent oxidoreductase (nitroreductase family)